MVRLQVTLLVFFSAAAVARLVPAQLNHKPGEQDGRTGLPDNRKLFAIYSLAFMEDPVALNQSLVHPRGAVAVVTRTPTGTDRHFLVRFPNAFAFCSLSFLLFSSLAVDVPGSTCDF